MDQTELLLKKGPSLLSYRELDSGLGEELFETYGSHYGTMVAHGFFMTLAFALALPLCEPSTLTSAKRRPHNCLRPLTCILSLIDLTCRRSLHVRPVAKSPDIRSTHPTMHPIQLYSSRLPSMPS